jgi:hypothetical protein
VAHRERIAFLLLWSVLLVLTAANRDYVRPFQAFIRAETVPAAVIGLAVALEGVAFDAFARSGLVTVTVTLFVTQLLYVTAGPVIVQIALFATAAVLLWRSESKFLPRTQLALVMLAMLASECAVQYIDYPVNRIGPLPATAIVAALRICAAAVILAVGIKAVKTCRDLRSPFTRVGVLVALLALGAAQVVYFHFHLSAEPWLRFTLVAVIFATVAGLSSLVSGGSDAPGLAPADATAAGVFTLLCLRLIYP